MEMAAANKARLQATSSFVIDSITSTIETWLSHNAKRHIRSLAERCLRSEICYCVISAREAEWRIKTGVHVWPWPAMTISVHNTLTATYADQLEQSLNQQSILCVKKLAGVSVHGNYDGDGGHTMPYTRLFRSPGTLGIHAWFCCKKLCRCAQGVVAWFC